MCMKFGSKELGQRLVLSNLNLCNSDQIFYPSKIYATKLKFQAAKLYINSILMLEESVTLACLDQFYCTTYQSYLDQSADVNVVTLGAVKESRIQLVSAVANSPVLVFLFSENVIFSASCVNKYFLCWKDSVPFEVPCSSNLASTHLLIF